MRLSYRMRRHTSLKSNTCTEGTVVYTADISVKVNAHYPGRSHHVPLATVVVKRSDAWREVSRGHISRPTSG